MKWNGSLAKGWSRWREKKKGKVVIRGMEVERNERKQGAERLFKDIRAKVEVKEI